jgi:hypothetical protein
MFLLATVSIFWQWGTILLSGIILGIVISVKWISPPHDEINVETRFGKLVVKGKRHSSITDVLDVTDIADVVSSDDGEGEKLSRKAKRIAKRAERKTRKLKSITNAGDSNV